MGKLVVPPIRSRGMEYQSHDGYTAGIQGGMKLRKARASLVADSDGWV